MSLFVEAYNSEIGDWVIEKVIPAGENQFLFFLANETDLVPRDAYLLSSRNQQSTLTKIQTVTAYLPSKGMLTWVTESNNLYYIQKGEELHVQLGGKNKILYRLTHE